VAVIGGGLSVLGSWALIGFAGFGEYPHLLRVLTAAFGPESFSLASLSQAAGTSAAVGLGLQRFCGIALLTFAGAIARRRHGDRRAFAAAVLAALVLSPVVWLHYFALLVVPIAILQPRMGAAWAIPLGFWLTLFLPSGGAGSGGVAFGYTGNPPPTPKLVLVLGLALLTLACTTMEWPRLRRRRGPASKGLPAGWASEFAHAERASV
jgi:hypothetical protein